MNITIESLRATYSNKDSETLLSIHQSGNLTDIAYNALEMVLVERGIQPPIRPSQHITIEMKDPLSQYWYGEKGVKYTFWFPSVIGSLLVILFSYAVAHLFGVSYLRRATLDYMTGPYLIFATILLWRNSKTVKFRFLKFILLFVLMMIITSPFYFYAWVALR